MFVLNAAVTLLSCCNEPLIMLKRPYGLRETLPVLKVKIGARIKYRARLLDDAQSEVKRQQHCNSYRL